MFFNKVMEILHEQVIDQYLSDIKGFNLLSKEDEINLAKGIKNNIKEAKDQLVLWKDSFFYYLKKCFLLN